MLASHSLDRVVADTRYLRKRFKSRHAVIYRARMSNKRQVQDNDDDSRSSGMDLFECEGVLEIAS